MKKILIALALVHAGPAWADMDTAEATFEENLEFDSYGALEAARRLENILNEMSIAAYQAANNARQNGDDQLGFRFDRLNTIAGDIAGRIYNEVVVPLGNGEGTAAVSRRLQAMDRDFGEMNQIVLDIGPLPSNLQDLLADSRASHRDLRDQLNQGGGNWPGPNPDPYPRPNPGGQWVGECHANLQLITGQTIRQFMGRAYGYDRNNAVMEAARQAMFACRQQHNGDILTRCVNAGCTAYQNGRNPGPY